MTAHEPADAPVLAPGLLAHVFVEVADSLTADFDVVDFLHTVASRAAQILQIGTGHQSAVAVTDEVDAASA